MLELPSYLIVAPEEFQAHVANGTISLGIMNDSHRNPLVIGTYKRKPVYCYKTEAEKQALIDEDLDLYYQLRGVKMHHLASLARSNLGRTGNE
jgi:hypothetical protein